MKNIKISTINTIVGILLMAIVIIKDIQDTKGFALFIIGFFLLISGILLSKKLREVIINFIINFF